MRRTKDGTGAPLIPDGEYYIQDSRPFVGNCILWWAKDSQGYTCNLDHAGVYLGKDCPSRETDVPWPKAYVEARVVRHVRGDNADFCRNGS